MDDRSLGAARTLSVPGPALVPQGSAKLTSRFLLRGAILRPCADRARIRLGWRRRGTNLNRDANHGCVVYSTGIVTGFSSQAAGPQAKEFFSALPEGSMTIRSKSKKACGEFAIVFAAHETGPQVGERPFRVGRLMTLPCWLRFRAC